MNYIRGRDTAHKNAFKCSYLESKTEQSVERHRTTFGGGDTAEIKHILGGGTPHILIG